MTIDGVYQYPDDNDDFEREPYTVYFGRLPTYPGMFQIIVLCFLRQLTKLDIHLSPVLDQTVMSVMKNNLILLTIIVFVFQQENSRLSVT